MNRKIAVLVLSSLLPTLAVATPVEDENARLRIEVEQLKAQLISAKASCAASSAASEATIANPASRAPVAARPAAPPATPAPSTPPVPTAAEPPKSVEVPAGYALVKIEPVISRDDRWRDGNHWDALSRGMTPMEVEELLGVEHSVTEGDGRLFWGYGKIGVLYSGRVIFVNGRLAVWTKPDA